MKYILPFILFTFLSAGCTEPKTKKFSKESFFYEPTKLCQALIPQGIMTQSWRPNPAIGSEWFCQSESIALAEPQGFNPASSVVYRVTGESRQAVFAISFHLKIFSQQDYKQVWIFMENALNSLFATMKQPIPQQLMTQMKQNKNFTMETPYGMILMNRSGQSPELIEWSLFKRSYLTNEKSQAIQKPVHFNQVNQGITLNDFLEDQVQTDLLPRFLVDNTNTTTKIQQ